MASRLDLEDVRDGYFYTEFIETVYEYVIKYLNEYNHSCAFVIHMVGLFTKDDTSKELHMPNQDMVIFDPNEPGIAEYFEMLKTELYREEAWGPFESSGWSFVPGTESFWFKIIACQPNNTPTDNKKNTAEAPEFEDDPDNPDDPKGTDDKEIECYDTFLLSLALHHCDPSLRKQSQKRRYGTLRQWVFDNNLTPGFRDGLITPTNLPTWHKSKPYNIRVFSDCGNVIYVKTNCPDDDEYIDFLWKYKKFKLITNLWSLLQEHTDRVFCGNCKSFHRNERACELKIHTVKEPELQVPVFPEGRHGLVVYADFESILDKGHHSASGYAYIAIGKNKEVLRTKCVSALDTDDVVDDFISEICHFAENYVNVICRPSDICQICGDNLPPHERFFTGKNFINNDSGSYHKHCWKHPHNSCIVYFHNFKGYDSHYVVKGLMDFTDITFLRGKSFEKFDIINACYHKINIAFKDTFNFLSTSIAKLVPDVQTWQYTPEDQRDNKGIFPYEWFDSVDKLLATSLPPAADWKNDLTNTMVDPEPAYQIWNAKGFNHLVDYHNYYVQQDVMQLADIFEEFRNGALQVFNLDPVYFQGAPGYTWQIGLMKSAYMMSIIPSKDIYLDIQRSIRGGISQVMHRYKNIEDKPDECILYLDVNSLYSKCMTYKLPSTYIRTLNELPSNWQQRYCMGDDITALICVDLYYPEHLHDLHYPYPLAPHKFNGRLCTTFERKEHYLVHAEVLDFYLNEGLILENVYYLYEFTQDYILRDYVNENIVERRATNSTALKTLYKLLNNSLYGKTCENIFKYKKYQVKKKKVGQRGKVNSFIKNSSNFMEINNQILSESKILEVTLNKPIQIGFTVLEFAKREMYNFLFKVQKLFGDKVTPLYTDTDSVMLHFTEPHPEETMFADNELKKLLDFDKVPDHWKVRTPGTDKQSGLWSLECSNKIVEYVGLRAKTYCYRTEDNVTVLKNKGITKAAVELKTGDKLTMEHYKRAIYDNQDFYVVQSVIRSKKHDITTYKQKKLALSSIDEKRQVLKNLLRTVPFGYKGERFKREYQNLL